MTKLLVGVGTCIMVLMALVMLMSVGIIGGSAAPPTAQHEVPPNYLALYRSTADTCPGLPWSVLAVIGKVETDHGRLQAPGVTSGANFTAASYLCRNGGGKGGDLSRAIFAYNHADWYVTKVLAIASTLRRPGPPLGGGGPAPPPNHDVAAIAIQFPYKQLGKPYVGGAEGDNFYDCSGLMQRAYKEAGVQLPRTSREQWYAGGRGLATSSQQAGRCRPARSVGTPRRRPGSARASPHAARTRPRSSCTRSRMPGAGPR